MGFSIDLSSLQSMRQRVQNAIDTAEQFCATATDEVSTRLVEELQAEAPYDGAANNGVIPGEDGHLRDSFGSNEATPGQEATGEVWTSEPIKYGYVTQGTASPILPVQKLALWWPDAEHPVSWVSGQQANPFQEKAKDTVESELQDIVAPVINEWLSGA